MVDRRGEARMARRVASDARGRQHARSADAARERAPLDGRRLSASAAEPRTSTREQPATTRCASHTPMPVDRIPGFDDGVVSVQDAGAQLAAQLLGVRDGMRVLDACAAPGGKTGHLLELANVATRRARKRCVARAAHRRKPAAAEARSGSAHRRRGRRRPNWSRRHRSAVRPHSRRRAVFGVGHRAASSGHPLAAPRRRTFPRSSTSSGAFSTRCGRSCNQAANCFTLRVRSFPKKASCRRSGLETSTKMRYDWTRRGNFCRRSPARPPIHRPVPMPDERR